MQLGYTDADKSKAAQVLERAEISLDDVQSTPYAILNPGGNNHAKRWPKERFAKIADHISKSHNLRVLINGSPNETELIQEIINLAESNPVSLPSLGNTLGALKPIIENARILITNDTGPRHIAAAFGTPLITLFGPTDPRWTTIPTKTLPDGSSSEIIIVADATLPPDQSANDHPERCSIEHISLDGVIESINSILNRLV